MNNDISTDFSDTCVYYGQLYLSCDNYARPVYPVCGHRSKCALKKVMDLYHGKVLQTLSKQNPLDLPARIL